MKSLLIDIDSSSIQCVPNPNTYTNVEYPYVWKLSYPILSAFSVEYFTVQDGALSAIFTNEEIQ